MHGQYVGEVEPPQLGHDLTQVVGWCRRLMEAADQRVDLLDARYLLRPPQRVDDAGMATGADDHQSAITQPEAGSVFVPVLVGNRFAGELVGGEVVLAIGTGVAADTILRAEFDPGVGAVRAQGWYAARRLW